MSARKFTDAQAIAAISNKSNLTIQAVLREISGCSEVSGSNHQLIRRIALENNLDTSHWLGQRIAVMNRGVARGDVMLLLVKNSSCQSSHALKLRLIRDGIKEARCEECNNVLWNGLTIPLDLHHVNGDKKDYRLENLRLLCPNCHAQTPNYCSKNQKQFRNDPVAQEQEAHVSKA